MQAFDKYAIGETNETYELYIFHTRKQGESETVESFITALRTLVKTCNFCHDCVSLVLRDQVVLGIHNPQTQAELLKIRQLDLQGCLDICKLSENATVQFRILRPEGVNKVDFKPKRKTPAQTERECRACARRHGLNKELCPAFGKTCYKCNGKNHFAVKCKLSRKKNVQTFTTQPYDHENDRSGSDYGQVDNIKIKEKVNAISQEMIKAEMMVKRKPIAFQLDSGASVNILNEKHVMGKTLEHSNKTLVMWNGAEVKPLGECQVKIINPKTGQKYAVIACFVGISYFPEHYILGTRNELQDFAL